MTKPTLDAAALAERMNARPLPPDTDGGFWEPALAYHHNCEQCRAVMDEMQRCVVCEMGAGGTMYICLPCALAECERAESHDRPQRSEAGPTQHKGE